MQKLSGSSAANSICHRKRYVFHAEYKQMRKNQLFPIAAGCSQNRFRAAAAQMEGNLNKLMHLYAGTLNIYTLILHFNVLHCFSVFFKLILLSLFSAIIICFGYACLIYPRSFFAPSIPEDRPKKPPTYNAFC